MFLKIKKKIILLEWPKFKLELSQFDPLSVNISFLNDEKDNLSELRRISLSGSKKWDNKFTNLH